MADNAALVAKYIQIRDARAALKRQFEDKDAQFKEAQERIEKAFLAHLDAHGMDSAGTEHGTFYKDKSVSVTVADWDQVLPFIRDNNMWSMLDKRVNKTAVEEYVKEHEDLPPGVNRREEVVVRVRRG